MPAASVAYPGSHRPAPGASRSAPDPLDPAEIDRVVRLALREDVGSGDLTTDALVGPLLRLRAEILLKEPGVVAGLPLAAAVFRALSADIFFEPLVADGAILSRPGQAVARLQGPARAILTGERTALNLLGQLSGIATLTRRFVDAVAGTGAVILDTRKTTPGLRAVEKYAVRCGGGRNHRFGLYDAILIKDNHLQAAGGVGPAVAAARAALPGRPVEVEVDTIAQVDEALAAGADRILLDNMSVGQLHEAVAHVGGRVPLEASGGVTLATVRAIAATGVDVISVGAVTHSALSLDVSLEVLS